MPSSMDQSVEFSQPKSTELGGVSTSVPDRHDFAVALKFRQFQLFHRARLLFREGQTVIIGDRAFDLLTVLLKARGTVLSKNEIMRQVWPSTIVDESNLRFQMTMLRKILGSDRDIIKTVSGRGYVLAADIDIAPAVESEPTALPVMPTSSSAAGATRRGRSLQFTSSPGHSHSKVIVVESDQGLCERLNGFLQSAGIVVECFSSVEEFFVRSKGASAA